MSNRPRIQIPPRLLARVRRDAAAARQRDAQHAAAFNQQVANANAAYDMVIEEDANVDRAIANNNYTAGFAQVSDSGSVSTESSIGLGSQFNAEPPVPVTINQHGPPARIPNPAAGGRTTEEATAYHNTGYAPIRERNYWDLRR